MIYQDVFKGMTINYGVRISLAVCLMIIAVLSHADSYEPVAHCYKPEKPLIFSTQYYKNRYTEDVEYYHRCLKSFINHQENAAKIHQEAAKNALKTWNDFAKQQ